MRKMRGTMSSAIQAYSLTTAASVSGLSTHMLNYLCRHGIVTPSAQKQRGRGFKRAYSYGDLILLRVIARLLRQGISALRLKKSLRALQRRGIRGDELLSNKFLVTDGYDVFVEKDGVAELLESGQLTFAFVLQIDAVRGEVQAKIQAPRIKVA